MLRPLLMFMLLGLVLQACAMARPFEGYDEEGAFFSSLFDGPSGAGSCRQLRRELDAELESLKAAQKKADDDFIAEQSAPVQQAPPRRRRFGRRNDEMTPLKDLARRTRLAEETNRKLQVRGCRTVDIEQALKTQPKGPPKTLPQAQ
jgi:hypothetical protein